MTSDYVIYDEVAAFSLAAANRTETDPQLEADMARLTLIRQARDRGATWNTIGGQLGMTGREAKRHAHHLHATTRRAWYLHHNQEPAPPAEAPEPEDPGTEFWSGVAEREGIKLLPAKPPRPRKRKRR